MVWIIAEQSRTERNESDGHQQQQVQHKRRSVHAPEEMKEHVMVNPDDADDNEAGDKGQDLVAKCLDHPDEVPAVFREVRHLDLDDEQRHDDGEDAIRKSFKAGQVP